MVACKSTRIHILDDFKPMYPGYTLGIPVVKHFVYLKLNKFAKYPGLFTTGKGSLPGMDIFLSFFYFTASPA